MLDGGNSDSGRGVGMVRDLLGVAAHYAIGHSVANHESSLPTEEKKAPAGPKWTGGRRKFV